MKCCLCKSEIDVEPSGWDQGHSAEPVMAGRCCSTCNTGVVLPIRLASHFPGLSELDAKRFAKEMSDELARLQAGVS